jgi:hypothetical protein
MCFSAGASFTAGVLLTFVGSETLRKVHKPSQLALASIPVFFAAQQFTEGVLWSTLAARARRPAKHFHAPVLEYGTGLGAVLHPLPYVGVVLLRGGHKLRDLLHCP